MKGAVHYTKAGDVSTGANVVSEGRNETSECSEPGLSGCDDWRLHSRSHLSQLLAGDGENTYPFAPQPSV